MTTETSERAHTLAPPALAPERAERVAEIFKALSDPIRVRLLHHISANCCSSVCICHIPDDFGISQPTLSYHLGRLLKAGLIDKEMQGKWAHYTATEGGLNAIRDYLSDLQLETADTCACAIPGSC